MDKAAELRHEVDLLEAHVEDLRKVYAHRATRGLQGPQGPLGACPASLETIMEFSGGWKLQKHQEKHLEFSEDGGQKLEVKTDWILDQIPDLTVSMNFDIFKPQTGFSRVENFKILITPVLGKTRKFFENGELVSLMSFSQEHKMSSFFFLYLEELFIHFRRRREVLEEESFKSVVVETDQERPFTFLLGSQEADLAKVTWKIEFDPRSLTIADEVRVRLSRTGRELAEECNFPQSIIDRGNCPEWDSKEHIRNIIQLVRLH